jgi:hypothetical protein
MPAQFASFNTGFKRFNLLSTTTTTNNNNTNNRTSQPTTKEFKTQIKKLVRLTRSPERQAERTMMSITNMPIDQAYMLLGAPACQSMIGGSFRIDHLTSEKGQTLNGKTCRVLKFTADPKNNPEMRLVCQLDEGGKPILLKLSNLIRVEANIMRTLMEGSLPLTDEKIMIGLKQGLSQHSNGFSDRKDLNHRIRLYQTLLKKLEKAPKNSEKTNVLNDEDYCFPCGATYANNSNEFDTAFDYIMTMARPACVGNNLVDMRLMDLGLKGNGTDTCSVCTEVLLDTSVNSNCDEVLVTLPCVHMFHEACLCQWLKSDLGRRNWSCPTCRHPVPHNLSTYHVKYDTQLRNRFQEFLLSGFCHKCILWVMEKDRNQSGPAINENGEEITMGCVGQMQNAVYMSPPPME